MLSIGRMAYGQGKYYLDLAREDYYLAGGEPPGQWYGAGAAALGLSGTVERPELERLFAGFDPDGQPLVQNAGRPGHRPGFDLTFSAPKSVSVLWSQAEPETRTTIQSAHAEAVEAALGYLQEVAGFSRRGRGGSELVRASLVFACFEHGTSRALDPQLHTHALALNATIGEDGRTATLEGHGLYEHKMTAGAIYRTELAHQLRTRLGVTLQAVQSWFEVRGVPQNIIDFFSKRRSAIEEHLKSKGLESATAAAFAALETREVKELVPPRDELFAEWSGVASSLGFTPEHVKGLVRGRLASGPNLPLTKFVQEAAARIAESESHFAERDVLRHVAEKVQTHGIAARTLIDAVRRELAQSPEIVRLGEQDGQQRYTTKASFRLESELLDVADKLHADRTHHVPRQKVEAVLSRPRQIDTGQGKEPITLSAEQVAAVRTLTQDGGGRIRVLEGVAGSAKTATLGVVREAWEAAGYQVVGVALAGKAAKELKRGAGIENSMTIARFEMLTKSPSFKDAVSHEAKQVLRALTGRGRLPAPTFPALKPKKTVGEVLSHEAKQLARALIGKRRTDPSSVRWRKATFGDVLKHEAAQVGRAFAGKKRFPAPKYVPDKRPLLPFNKKTVLIVDEAGMVGTKQLCHLMKTVERAGAVIILAGDRRQLQAIEAGGPFQHLADRLGHAALSTIMRQRDERDRESVAAVAEGRPRKALEDLATRGLLTVSADRVAAMNELVTLWTKNEVRKPDDALIFCGTNREADVLNQQCQEARRTAGILRSSDRLSFDGGHIYTGDRVLFTANSRPLGVHNGETATVVAVSQRTSSLSVLLDSGERRRIPLREYKNVRLGYAVTTHKGQGTTVERAYVLAGGFMQDREISYVQLSRAREATYVFTDRSEAGDTLDNLVRQMRKSRAKNLAHDVLSHNRHQGLAR